MYCRNCGRELTDNNQFCTYCGMNRNHGYAAPSMPPEARDISTAALVWGIVAVVFCQLPLSFIFGIIGQNKVKEAEKMGIENGMVKAGRIMSLIGLILGIAFTVFWAIFLLIMVGLFTFAVSSPLIWN
ncbi:MAG TPA: zinc-ribbon domain-containing protein [Oscillospiraceae bacterium]|nr:zinc-ribbon domain-containing protein [Oscillospiraceae bacterium]